MRVFIAMLKKSWLLITSFLVVSFFTEISAQQASKAALVNESGDLPTQTSIRDTAQSSGSLTPMMSGKAAGQGIPFDSCGVLNFVSPPTCITLTAFSGRVYELYGDLGEFDQFDTVEIAGEFHLTPSICMIGECCVEVQSIDSCDLTGVESEIERTLPYRVELCQNYPNPFNMLTTIVYNLPSRAPVTIEVFNLLGKKIRTLVDETRPAGAHRIEWDGDDDDGMPVSSGVYLCHFRVGDMVQVKKMLLMK